MRARRAAVRIGRDISDRADGGDQPPVYHYGSRRDRTNLPLSAAALNAITDFGDIKALACEVTINLFPLR